ncbi:hypothetical protein ACF0H5_013361 [Mactra antiquata]
MANSSNSTSQFSFEDAFTSLSTYKAGVMIWKVVPPILILLGTVGNVLSILVLTRKSIRTSTTAVYLTVLACSDLSVLYSGLLRQWLIYQFEVDVRKISEFGCKLNILLVYSSLDFSAWILIAVTLERVISAWFPHNARSVCTKKSAVAFLITIGVFLLCLNSHLLYGMTFKYNTTENGSDIVVGKCVEVNPDYYDFFNKQWPWIDLCAFCAIPSTVIVIGNGLILFKVLKSQKKTKARIVPTIAGGSRQTTGNAGKQSSMTAILFTLNVVFLISTSPISIYNVGYAYWADGASPELYAVLDLWWAVVNMLMYTNNSLNFLLYCLSGTKFRREVIRMFCCRNNSAASTGHHAMSNYTRTRFDTNTHTPSPSPRNSPAPDTPKLNEKTGSDNKNMATNDKQEVVHTVGNTLHPCDALRRPTTQTKTCTLADSVADEQLVDVSNA